MRARPSGSRPGEDGPRAILEAAREGKSIELLTGLNSVTSPKAVSEVFGVPNLALRYLTHKFHAKIYLFDQGALLGSSNLTDGGLLANREAVICLDRPEDLDAVEEVRALFQDLWGSAQVLTDDVLRKFRQAHSAIRSANPDLLIENAIGRVEPRNIDVASQTKSSVRIFLEDIRRIVYEQYRPAFLEVTEILQAQDFRRPDCFGPASAGLPVERQNPFAVAA